MRFEILFEHDSVQTHTILKTEVAITKLRKTVLPQPLYCPNLLRQIFTFFWSAQRKEREMFGVDEEVNGEVTDWLRLQNSNW